MRYLNWVMARLAGRRAGHGVIVVALVLVLPSLFSRFFIDEYVQAARWRAAHDHAVVAGIGKFLNDCFLFAGGDQAALQREMEHGMVAWWPSATYQSPVWMSFLFDCALNTASMTACFNS